MQARVCSPEMHLLCKEHDTSDHGVLVCGHCQAAAALDAVSHDDSLHTSVGRNNVGWLGLP